MRFAYGKGTGSSLCVQQHVNRVLTGNLEDVVDCQNYLVNAVCIYVNDLKTSISQNIDQDYRQDRLRRIAERQLHGAGRKTSKDSQVTRRLVLLMLRKFESSEEAKKINDIIESYVDGEISHKKLRLKITEDPAFEWSERSHQCTPPEDFYQSMRVCSLIVNHTNFLLHTDLLPIDLNSYRWNHYKNDSYDFADDVLDMYEKACAEEGVLAEILDIVAEEEWVCDWVDEYTEDEKEDRDEEDGRVPG